MAVKNIPALLLFAAILLLGGRSLFAQENKPVISLHLDKWIHPDEKRHVNQLIDEGNLLFKSDPDRAIALYETVLQLSKRLNYVRGISVAYNNMSAAYKEKGLYDKAIACIQESMRISAQMNGSFSLQQYADLSDLYYNKGNYQGILELIKDLPPQALTNSRPVNAEWAKFQKYLAISYFRTGNYDSALTCYYRILATLNAPTSGDFTIFVETYNGLGAVSACVGSDIQAFAYFSKALSLAILYKDTNRIIMSLGNVSGAYINLKNYKKAKDLCMSAIKVARRMKYYSYQSLNAHRMAVILNTQGEHREALQYCKEAYESAEKIKNFDNQISASYIMGYTYLQLKNYKAAEKYILPAMYRAREKGKIDNIADAYSQLADIYVHSGRLQKAYEYQKLYAQMQDSLRGAENARRIASVEIKYKTAEKDKRLIKQQLLLTRKENKLREKNLLISGIIISSILILTIALVKYNHKQKLQAEQFRNLANQQEIERLNFRMQGEELERGRIAQELHDGVSVLLSAAKMNFAAIGKENKSLAETEVYKEVMQLLSQTGQEVRSISYNLVPELLIRQSLPAAVQAFCELMQKGHSLNIELQVYGSFAATDSEFNYVVYRIVQELIHNIVKHAHAKEVLLQLTLHNHILQLTVEDNGIGFEESQSPAGMGLRNLRKRVENLNGQLSFTSAAYSGTTVEIELPVVINGS